MFCRNGCKAEVKFNNGDQVLKELLIAGDIRVQIDVVDEIIAT
jgi:hypothetical protein